MGCRAPPDGEVFRGRFRRPTRTHFCTPTLSPSTEASSFTATGADEKRRHVRRSRARVANSPPPTGGSLILRGAAIRLERRRHRDRQRVPASVELPPAATNSGRVSSPCGKSQLPGSTGRAPRMARSRASIGWSACWRKDAPADAQSIAAAVGMGRSPWLPGCRPRSSTRGSNRADDK